MKISTKLVESISTNQRITNTVHEGYAAVHTDSRKPMNDGLFVPLVGDRFDGHDFLLKAIEQGATAALWQKGRKLPTELPTTFQVYEVHDTLAGLQQLSKVYLKEVNPIVVGVTGSNGKTTTKDILSSVLSQRFKTYKTQGNFNNHIGLPLTILQMESDCELIILEMGMNHFNEISLLSKLAEPDYTIVTNIGESHIENLGSREGIAKAKMEILDGLKSKGKAFIDGDEPLLKKYYDKNVITCGYENTNQVQISSYQADESGYRFLINEEDFSYRIPLLGKHNVKNAAYAIALASELNFSSEDINIGLGQIALTTMRLEKLRGKNGALIINDAYNASPTSMKAGIEALKELQGYRERILILGDMYELGANEEDLHRSVAEVISSPITHVFAIGEKGKWIGEELQKQDKQNIKIEMIIDKTMAAKKIEPLLNKNCALLIKASRGHKLETIVEELIP